jgi:hypothetical protein
MALPRGGAGLKCRPERMMASVLIIVPKRATMMVCDVARWVAALAAAMAERTRSWSTAWTATAVASFAALTSCWSLMMVAAETARAKSKEGMELVPVEKSKGGTGGRGPRTMGGGTSEKVPTWADSPHSATGGRAVTT